MAKQPTINGKVVERSYEDYRNDLYLVNRRYQRKLVWGIDEKQAFIDSLANGYPVPLRNISTRIRGDVSHDDFLLLSQMQNISIAKEGNHGGIDPDQVFWVKENIITKEDLRQSVDEEQVADLLGAMLIDPIPPSNVSVLDEYYGYKRTDSALRYQKIEELITAVSSEILSEQFFCVFDEIKRIFQNRPKTIIGQMVSPRTYKGPRYFQVLFLSLFDLLIKQEKKINDYDGIYNYLESIASRTLNIAAGGGWWSQQEKIELVKSTSANLVSYFVERAEGDPMYYSYANELMICQYQNTTGVKSAQKYEW